MGARKGRRRRARPGDGLVLVPDPRACSLVLVATFATEARVPTPAHRGNHHDGEQARMVSRSASNARSSTPSRRHDAGYRRLGARDVL